MPGGEGEPQSDARIPIGWGDHQVGVAVKDQQRREVLVAEALRQLLDVRQTSPAQGLAGLQQGAGTVGGCPRVAGDCNEGLWVAQRERERHGPAGGDPHCETLPGTHRLGRAHVVENRLEDGGFEIDQGVGAEPVPAALRVCLLGLFGQQQGDLLGPSEGCRAGRCGKARRVLAAPVEQHDERDRAPRRRAGRQIQPVASHRHRPQAPATLQPFAAARASLRFRARSDDAGERMPCRLAAAFRLLGGDLADRLA